MTRVLFAVVAVAALTGTVAGQAADFAGTWQLDTTRSQTVPAATIAGLIPTGAPPVLHVTQPANGTLLIESQINEGQSRLYKPNARTATPAGQGGTITMTSTWSGRTMLSEGFMEAPNGARAAVKETFTLSADGRTLTVDVVTTVDGRTHRSVMAYARIQSVGACESWPTPCKRAP